MQTQLNVVSKDDEVQDLLNNNNDDGIDTEDTENTENTENEHEDTKNTEHSSIEKSDKKLWESSQMQNRKKCLALNILLLDTTLWYIPPTTILLPIYCFNVC